MIVTWSWAYKTCHAQLLIMLINVKMPTIFSIFYIYKHDKYNILEFENQSFQYFSFNKQLKFHAQLGWAWKSCVTSGAWFLFRWLLQRQHFSICSFPCLIRMDSLDIWYVFGIVKTCLTSDERHRYVCVSAQAYLCDSDSMSSLYSSNIHLFKILVSLNS